MELKKWEKHLARYRFEALQISNKYISKGKEVDVFPLKRNGIDIGYLYFVGSTKQFKKFLKHWQDE